jgi:beta-phosphoglucomutase-like phosphatase (HAD superfamily)
MGYHEAMPETPEPIPAGSSRREFLDMPVAVVPAGAIFDCDGTLADTMPLHYIAWREILDPLDCPFPEELFYAWGGVSALEIMERLNRQHGLSLPAAETAHAKEENYRRLIPQVKPIEKVVAEARRLYGQCPLSVASGGMDGVVEQTLNTLGIRDLFVTIITPEQVQYGKPAPDMCLLAAERMGVAPEGCVVYEDAPAGFEAAWAAGMRAVNILRHV